LPLHGRIGLVRKSSLIPVTLATLLGAATLGACGARQTKTTTEVTELRRQLDALRRQSAHDQKAVHNMESRLFVCEDRLETARVAADRTPAAQPRLPVVKKRPPLAEITPEPAAPVEESIGIDDGMPASDGPVEIVYEGEAAREGTAPRRIIRIHEEAAPVEAPEEITDDGADRLPVVAAPEAPAAPPPVKPAGKSDPMAVYKAAYAALGARQHAVAIAGFKTFLELWPDHEYADNSQYWLGEAHYDRGDWKAALAEFRRVVEQHGRGNKAPDAMLKLGYCYARLGEAAAARDVLSQVIEIHPASDAAKLAAKKLSEMRRDP
jgi:tol-pal system protein YbgF